MQQNRMDESLGSLDREFERQGRRLDDNIFRAPTVRGLGDIKQLLVALDPARSAPQSVPLSSQLTAENDKGRPVTYNVSARMQTHDRRLVLLTGFQQLKSRQDVFEQANGNSRPLTVNGREMAPRLSSGVAAYSPIDALLERWLGATRDGLLICWNTPEGRYFYDIFQHRLWRAKPETAGTG